MQSADQDPSHRRVWQVALTPSLHHTHSAWIQPASHANSRRNGGKTPQMRRGCSGQFLHALRPGLDRYLHSPAGLVPQWATGRGPPLHRCSWCLRQLSPNLRSLRGSSKNCLEAKFACHQPRVQLCLGAKATLFRQQQLFVAPGKRRPLSYPAVLQSQN